MAQRGRPKGENDWAKLKDSPRAHRIMRWLRRQPVPARVLGETADGDELPVVLGQRAGNKSRTWTDAAKVLLPAEKITAYDGEGNILRVLELDPDDPELAAEAEALGVRRAAHGVTVPLISVDVPKLVDNIASNLRDVATAAASQQAQAFAQGFTAMTSVVNLCLTMLMRVEQRLADHQEELDEARAAAGALPEGSEGGASRDAMAMAALQAVMGGKQPNGAGGMSPEAIAAFVQQMARMSESGASGAPNGGS